MVIPSSTFQSSLLNINDCFQLEIKATDLVSHVFSRVSVSFVIGNATLESTSCNVLQYSSQSVVQVVTNKTREEKKKKIIKKSISNNGNHLTYPFQFFGEWNVSLSAFSLIKFIKYVNRYVNDFIAHLYLFIELKYNDCYLALP